MNSERRPQTEKNLLTAETPSHNLNFREISTEIHRISLQFSNIYLSNLIIFDDYQQPQASNRHMHDLKATLVSISMQHQQRRNDANQLVNQSLVNVSQPIDSIMRSKVTRSFSWLNSANASLLLCLLRNLGMENQTFFNGIAGKFLLLVWDVDPAHVSSPKSLHIHQVSLHGFQQPDLHINYPPMWDMEPAHRSSFPPR